MYFQRLVSLVALTELVVLIPIAGCGGGSSQKIQAPSNLVYPQQTITSTVGSAIATDTPIVTGTVATYSVTPNLPAGLLFSSTTGSISGTPTTTAAQADYTITASNISGSTTAVLHIAVNPLAPSNLVYPQQIIAGIVGTPIATDTPTVTGTETSFSVSTNLPPGLSLNGTTGAISGTPTTVSAEATYTVTASNITGSTSASVQISVNIAAPSNLVYSQQTISASVSIGITADIPTVTGMVTSYSVSPTLPTGLSLNTTTGVISGTPVTASAQASYTVTASNLNGTTTDGIKITIAQPSTTLIELGHATDIAALRETADRVLSEDYFGHWVLWDYTSANILASGDGGKVYNANEVGIDQNQIDIEGPLMAIGGVSMLQICASTDGHLLFTVPTPSWWKLATNGSYLVTGTTSGLTVWSPTGQAEVTRTGNYSAAVAFAAQEQVQIANGAAGNNAIETISLPAGTSTLSPTFLGNFYSWFGDGQRFLSTSASTLLVYSSGAMQQWAWSAPSMSGLGGYKNWIWFEQGQSVQFYTIGNSTPVVSFNGLGNLILSGSTLGQIPESGNSLGVIDLSGTSPVQTIYTLPFTGGILPFAAASNSQWIAGSSEGTILDGASLSNVPRYFGYGRPLAIAGSPNVMAVATATGKILLINPFDQTFESEIDFRAGTLVLSSDGSILAAASLGTC